MTEYNAAEIYDNPASQMTTREIFSYVGIDVITCRPETKTGRGE